MTILGTDLLADRAVSVLVHVLEDLLQRSLLAHKLSEGKTTIKVTIHSVEKIRHLSPPKKFICM